jgi:ABC-type uncharacterized transport system substrate-binding protein
MLLLPVHLFAQAPTKKVLILSGYDPSRPAVPILTRTIQSTITSGSTGRVEFFSEFQENTRILNEKYELEMVAYLRQKYASEDLSLIIGLGGPALRFLLKHEAELFTGTPKVFYFHDETKEAVGSLWPKVTGVWASFDISRTVDLALGLQPETKRLVVVSGNSEQDKRLRKEAEEQLRTYEGKLEITYVSNVTLEELKDTLAGLPEHTAVLYLSFSLDKAGHSFPPPQALAFISQTSRAPIYGLSETFVGSGMVGGSLLDFEALGRRTAEIGLRVMAGEKAQDIPPQTVTNNIVLDWRELRRWGMSERTLPAGSVVRFREPSFWELYRWYVIAIIAALLFEAGLIARLLLLQIRRRQA